MLGRVLRFSCSVKNLKAFSGFRLIISNIQRYVTLLVHIALFITINTYGELTEMRTLYVLLLALARLHLRETIPLITLLVVYLLCLALPLSYRCTMSSIRRQNWDRAFGWRIMEGSFTVIIKLLGYAQFILIVGITLVECVSILIKTMAMLLDDLGEFLRRNIVREENFSKASSNCLDDGSIKEGN